MNVTIAGTTFDQHEYDARGDVLYLSAGATRAPSWIGTGPSRSPSRRIVWLLRSSHRHL